MSDAGSLGRPSSRSAARVRWHLHGLNTGVIFTLTRLGVTHLPRAVSYGIGRVGTWLAFHLMRRATAALIENFRVVLPTLSERDLRRLALRTYRSYAVEVIDFVRSISTDHRALPSWLSPASAIASARPTGNGVILLTGHLGNIELGGVLIRVVLDRPIAAVLVPEPDPRVNEQRRLMRDSLGIETVEVGQAADTALRIRRLLAENKTVAVIADRPFGRDCVNVEFFGRRTKFLRSPALMGYLSGVPLVPAFILRQPDGRYLGISLEPIRVQRDGDREANVQAAMQAFATALEGVVRQYPHLWYHFYPYWGPDGS
jgi:KDO2-lipid IV(A) lauroyltransferase